MRIAWLLALLLALRLAAAEPKTTVYVALHGAAGAYAAKKIAAAVLGKAAVAIEWRSGGFAAVRVELAGHPGQERLPGALAVSYPYDGCSKRITVFMDRIRALAHSGGLEPSPLGDLRESALLAYVLVHEIAHVLEGTDRHSAAGVMKARWDASDRAAILAGRLSFLEEDVLLLQRGLAAGSCYAPPALIARSQPGTALHPE